MLSAEGFVGGGLLCFIPHDPAYNTFVVDLKAEVYASMLDSRSTREGCAGARYLEIRMSTKLRTGWLQGWHSDGRNTYI